MPLLRVFLLILLLCTLLPGCSKPITNSSVSNQLQVRITGFHPAPHPAETLVQLQLEGQPLQALLTTQSVERLGLQIGQLVYAQVKAVALD